MAEFFATMKPKGCGLCMGSYMGCLREVSCTSAIKDWLLSDRAEKNSTQPIRKQRRKLMLKIFEIAFLALFGLPLILLAWGVVIALIVDIWKDLKDD